MPEFDGSSLPEWLKAIHDSQNKWREQNWQKTLQDHSAELESLLDMVNVLHLWPNAVGGVEVSKKLLPEIVMDFFTSLHFACWGLYKSAHMCLRAGLETTLRLVYLSTHPVEYQWWLEGKEWYREGSPVRQDVWGPGYRYFTMLPGIKVFDKACDESRKLFGSKSAGIGELQSDLSKHIHSGPEQFQTEVNRISPQYDIGRFKRWLKRAKKALTFINIILALSFKDAFCDMHPEDREKIIDKGIADDDYRDKLKDVLGRPEGE